MRYAAMQTTRSNAARYWNAHSLMLNALCTVWQMEHKFAIPKDAFITIRITTKENSVLAQLFDGNIIN